MFEKTFRKEVKLRIFGWLKINPKTKLFTVKCSYRKLGETMTVACLVLNKKRKNTFKVN